LEASLALAKSNTCHVGGGSKGGQFCATSGTSSSGGKRTEQYTPGSGIARAYSTLGDGKPKDLSQMLALIKEPPYTSDPMVRLKWLKKDVEKEGGKVTIDRKAGIVQLHSANTPKQQQPKVTVPQAAALAQVEPLKGNSKVPAKFKDFSEHDPSLSFVGNAAAQKFAATVATQQHSKLSNFEAHAANDYSEWGYDVLNKKLRGDVKGLDSTSASRADRIDTALSSAFRKAAIPADVVVWRGAKTLSESITPGSILKDSGYVSTSLARRTATIFTETITYNQPSGVLFKINIKKGSPALVLGKLSKYPHEGEVLLPKGTIFKVTHVGPKATLTQPQVVHVDVI